MAVNPKDTGVQGELCNGQAGLLHDTFARGGSRHMGMAGGWSPGTPVDRSSAQRLLSPVYPQQPSELYQLRTRPQTWPDWYLGKYSTVAAESGEGPAGIAIAVSSPAPALQPLADPQSSSMCLRQSIKLPSFYSKVASSGETQGETWSLWELALPGVQGKRGQGRWPALQEGNMPRPGATSPHRQPEQCPRSHSLATAPCPLSRPTMPHRSLRPPRLGGAGQLSRVA